MAFSQGSMTCLLSCLHPWTCSIWPLLVFLFCFIFLKGPNSVSVSSLTLLTEFPRGQGLWAELQSTGEPAEKETQFQRLWIPAVGEGRELGFPSKGKPEVSTSAQIWAVSFWHCLGFGVGGRGDTWKLPCFHLWPLTSWEEQLLLFQLFHMQQEDSLKVLTLRESCPQWALCYPIQLGSKVPFFVKCAGSWRVSCLVCHQQATGIQRLRMHKIHFVLKLSRTWFLLS